MSFCGSTISPSSTSGSRFRPSSAAAPLRRRNLDQVFALQQERVVNRDNTVQIGNRVLQIARTRGRATRAGCRVMVYEHLDGATSIGYGPHVVARFAPAGSPERKETPQTRKGCGKAALLETVEKSPSRTFPPFPQCWEIPQTARDSHFPTASTTTVSLYEKEEHQKPKTGHIVCY